MPFLNKKKFVLTIGDDGVVLSFFSGGKLKERLFAASPNSAEAQAIATLCKRRAETPLYVLVDILDQAYVQHMLPPVSSFTINSLIKRKLNKDFAPNDIKAAIKFGRAQKARKDWIYMFASVHNVPPFSEWLEMALEFPNPFAGIYLLPLEAELTVRDLDKASEGQKRDKTAQWKMLIAHNRVGGMRQIIFRNYKLVLTRINQPVGDSTPEVLAGNIEQDLLSTIEFIRRVGFDEKEGLELFIISSAEIKANLDLSRINAAGVFLLTPQEAAARLRLAGAAAEGDRYGDVLLAANFAGKRRHIMRLDTAYSGRLRKLYALQYGAKAALGLFFLLALLVSAYLIGNYTSLSKDLRRAEQEKRQSAEKLEKLKKGEQAFPVEINRILNTMYLHDRLVGGATGVLDLLTKFSAAKAGNVLVTGIEAKTGDLAPDKDKKGEGKLSVTFSASIENTGKNIEQTLDLTDAMVKQINSVFADYDVKYTNLPGKNAINTQIGKAPDNKNATTFSVTIEEKKPVPTKNPAKPTAPAPVAKGQEKS